MHAKIANYISKMAHIISKKVIKFIMHA